ncbi:hypothetical protein NQ318_023155 [Aromia moschata]|uniref:Uncharacterized protein n=1 Tax=Aromia moschata TaxID=1265417 RepID=A0AAV8X9M0_9CUCU|nr:hypothetical protein NQ318_023155 [Aromia moschata]
MALPSKKVLTQKGLLDSHAELKYRRSNPSCVVYCTRPILEKIMKMSGNEEKSLDVLLSFTENPHNSIRRAANEHDISKSSVHNVLKRAKFHSFKVKLVHALNEDDFDRRVEFSENMMTRIVDDPNFPSNIAYSDEATFQLEGTLNRQKKSAMSTKKMAKKKPFFKYGENDLEQALSDLLPGKSVDPVHSLASPPQILAESALRFLLVDGQA